jgi:DNA topoisomerase III
MPILVVAEKPSVARDIAAVVGATERCLGYLSGPSHVVTWAIGHLVGLAEPGEMNAAWKKWRLEDLPILPREWPLVVSPAMREQFDVVRRLLHEPRISRVVCATDAGREGELIFRYIYEAARGRGAVDRLWISSLTPDAIKVGLRSMKPQASFDRLADAARARSRADWLVGMNLSRAYSIREDDHLSVGRVQTPTLAMIVERELAIRAFVPEDYLEVVATFGPTGEAGVGQDSGLYKGTFSRGKGQTATRLPPDGKEAAAIVDRAKRGLARVASVQRKSRRIPPPLLYDLTELQRHANRLYGMSAQRTLETAQSLYERYKLLSYPRTDSRHLSRDVAETIPDVVRTIAPAYEGRLAEGTGSRPLGPRFVDDREVSDHHAILPTTTRAPEDLPHDERRIYDLVCRRLLSAWHGDHVFAVTDVVTAVSYNGEVDRYLSSGSSVEEVGWKVLDVEVARKKPAGDDAEATLPGGLLVGLPRRVVDVRPALKKTKAPPRFTDATLLTAMETAGRSLDEEEASRAMRDLGLGTPATRAAILETLLKRQYLEREGKTLVATDKGVRLIERVHPHVKSPAMTGEWEAKLLRIERGEGEMGTFMDEIERYVTEVVETVAAPSPAPEARPSSSLSPVSHRSERLATTDLSALLHGSFGFESFRPYQEDVCRAAAGGRDVLLVMPTGAGKSLCYQLPGLARGGTTLVVSPLIALMEDQVAQLNRRGLVAERIHSGRDRSDSRAVCQAYLAGELDFLFIAPERLKVPGFPAMLAKRRLALIAIDEAHCISQWGHDFRPDYRMLGERLPLLRPAPVIALTATATPSVQDDIVSELRLESPARFIHGFRRTNIGVEVVERNPGQRAEIVADLLRDRSRRPAIVYAPTRKESEELAKDLSRTLPAAAYHAGLPAKEREDVQSRFLGSQLEVIVATIAFGMGIDKPNVRTVLHTALPGTVEGYYQEIGRAGRDGAPSRAVLLHSFVDTKTHEFFLGRDYPDRAHLETLHAAIPKSGASIEELSVRANLPKLVFDKALDKLWVHGGAVIDGDDFVLPGDPHFGPTYDAHVAHKRRALDKVRRFAETSSCRMLQLVAHFGDDNDSGSPCGVCDVCAPDACVAQRFREASSEEQGAAASILEALGQRDGRTVGQLHKDLFDGTLDRKALDHVLGALARATLVKLESDEFVKDGKTITFQRVFLAGESGDASRRLGALQVTPLETRKGRRGGRQKNGVAREPRGKRARVEQPEAESVSPLLVAALKSWRTSEAKRRRVPAFRIMSDRTLLGIADAVPTSEAALLAVHGIGMGLLEKYGKTLLSLVEASERGSSMR